MKPQLEAVQTLANRAVIETRAVGINWDDAKSARPVPINVSVEPIGAERKRKRIRRLLLRRFIVPTLTDMAMFVCLLALFSVYYVSSVGHTLGLRSARMAGWKRTGRLGHRLELALLFAIAFGFAGCVGYVGPDGGGAYVAGPDVYVGPEVYVVGGGFHDHDREFSRRGAGSRWHH